MLFGKENRYGIHRCLEEMLIPIYRLHFDITVCILNSLINFFRDREIHFRYDQKE